MTASAPAAAESPQAVLAARDVSVDLGGARVLDGVSLDVRAGEVLALVGPNGAGKSTLLGVLAGDIAPRSGDVLLDGAPLARRKHASLARERAVLTQEHTVSFAFRVREVVEMGRAPWSLESDAATDERAVAAALAATDATHLAERDFTTLSGGEKARSVLARVLAQQTRIVLLDEPTASLDLGHQEDVMRLGRDLAADGRAVVVVLHDLSLAGAYADRIAVLAGGRLLAVGTSTSVLTPAVVRSAYGVDVDVIAHDGRPLVVPRRGRRA